MNQGIPFMSNQPTPPDRPFIERIEALQLEHAVTATTPLSQDAQKNRVRIKNQIQHVVRVVEQRHGKRVAADLRARLEEEAAVIRPLARPAGWCVLTDGVMVESVLLPEPFPERLVEGTRYYVRPLIQAAAAHHECLVLALSQGEVRLHRLCDEQLVEVQVDGLPSSLTDVVGHEVEQQALQHHTAGGAIYHAQGKGNDDRGPEVERFLQAVDRAISGNRDLRDELLLVAAVEKLDALFRQLTQHRFVIDASVRLSPNQTSTEDLRTAAVEAFAKWRHEDAERFFAGLQEEGNIASEVGTVVRASIEGRVDTLIAERDQPLWGRFDEANWQVELHDAHQAASHDLIDVAMRATWRQSGHIRIVDREQHPDVPAPLMARLRF
jgi:hypothetical protein